MPQISVIIPIYNAEGTILETIESVRQQTFSDWEIIAVDDGSTDSTLELLSNFQDKRVKVLSYKNSGVAVARNRGISNANGEYIAFLDADDLWTSDKLRLQLAALQENPEAKVAYSWTYDFYDRSDAQKVLFPSKPIYFSGDVYPQLLIKNFLASGSNPLICRTAIESVGKFDPTCVPCEDWDFYLRLAASCFFVVVPKHQIFYRQSSNSGSSQVEALKKGGRLTIEKAYQATSPKLQYLKRQTIAYFYAHCTQQYLKNSPNNSSPNNIKIVARAGKILWTAIRSHPPILFSYYTLNLIKCSIKKLIQTLLPPWLTDRTYKLFKSGY